MTFFNYVKYGTYNVMYANYDILYFLLTLFIYKSQLTQLIIKYLLHKYIKLTTYLL